MGGAGPGSAWYRGRYESPSRRSMVVILSSSKLAKSLEGCAGKKDDRDYGSQVKMKSSALVNQSLGSNSADVALSGKHD
jgi:hypothetical protein